MLSIFSRSCCQIFLANLPLSSILHNIYMSALTRMAFLLSCSLYLVLLCFSLAFFNHSLFCFSQSQFSLLCCFRSTSVSLLFSLAMLESTHLAVLLKISESVAVHVSDMYTCVRDPLSFSQFTVTTISGSFYFRRVTHSYF